MTTNHSIFNQLPPSTKHNHRTLSSNGETGEGEGEKRKNLECVLAEVVKTYFPNEAT